MAIILIECETLARLVKSGEGDVLLVAGQSVKVETSPGGEELLNVECPAGKAWSARVIVEITETDV